MWKILLTFNLRIVYNSIENHMFWLKSRNHESTKLLTVRILHHNELKSMRMRMKYFQNNERWEIHWNVIIMKKAFLSHLCLGGRFGTKMETSISASSISLLWACPYFSSRASNSVGMMKSLRLVRLCLHSLSVFSPLFDVYQYHICPCIKKISRRILFFSFSVDSLLQWRIKSFIVNN